MTEPVVPEPGPLPYHLLQRGGRPGVWRPIVGVVVLALWMQLLGPLLFALPLAAYALASGQKVADYLASVGDFANLTPLALVYIDVVLASLLGMVLLVSWLLHGIRPGWMSSVRPRLRWGFLVVCFVLAAVSLALSLLLSGLLPAGAAPEGAEMTGGLNPWTDQMRDFLLVVVFLTPLQAAGEEYAFRGYLTQAFGALFDRVGPRVGRLLAVVGPAVLFALAHGIGQEIPVFFDRLAFGLVAGVLVQVTGGLEAGIAMHVVNNWLAFGVALAFGDMGATLTVTEGSWWMIPPTLVQSLAFLGLAWVTGRGFRLQRVSTRPVLPPPGRRR